jgi:hypothetical protein
MVLSRQQILAVVEAYRQGLRGAAAGPQHVHRRRGRGTVLQLEQGLLASEVTCRNGRSTRSPNRRITLKLHCISLQNAGTYLFRPRTHALKQCELCVVPIVMCLPAVAALQTTFVSASTVRQRALPMLSCQQLLSRQNSAHGRSGRHLLTWSAGTRPRRALPSPRCSCPALRLMDLRSHGIRELIVWLISRLLEFASSVD